MLNRAMTARFGNVSVSQHFAGSIALAPKNFAIVHSECPCRGLSGLSLPLGTSKMPTRRLLPLEVQVSFLSSFLRGESAHNQTINSVYASLRRLFQAVINTIHITKCHYKHKIHSQKLFWNFQESAITPP